MGHGPTIITDKCYAGTWCTKCSIPLISSKYKDETVFVVTNQRNTRGYCVKCAQQKKKVTIDDLDKFIAEKLIPKAIQLVFG